MKVKFIYNHKKGLAKYSFLIALLQQVSKKRYTKW